MNILLVEDETGLREGLAVCLRQRGLVVRGAGSCAEGLQLLADERFDLVVTDWRLGDGGGDEIVARCSSPVVVISGYPDEVEDHTGRVVVLRKPVKPADLFVVIEQQLRPAAAAPASFAARLAALPSDTVDRLRLAWALSGEAPQAELLDDGSTVTLRTPLLRDEDQVLSDLEGLGGDLRILGGQTVPMLELRLWRDSRPDDVSVIEVGERWPSEGALAIDLARGACLPAEFVALAERVARSCRRGRTVELLNVPPHLRLHLELLGKAALLPKRSLAGPRLPEVLVELWRQQ